MDSILYVIDISRFSITNNFKEFMLSFASTHSVALISSQTASSIDSTLLYACKYIFASDGDEFYVNGELKYRNILVLSAEVQRWINSLDMLYTVNINNVHIQCDPYVSAQLVREFNNLFDDYKALSCANGLFISTGNNARRHIISLIDEEYIPKLITSSADLGNANAELATAISQRGSCFYATDAADVQELLLVLSQE